MRKYIIKGSFCGRDKFSMFRCICGKCKALPLDVSHDSNDSGRDGRNSGDGGYHSVDDEAVAVGTFL